MPLAAPPVNCYGPHLIQPEPNDPVLHCYRLRSSMNHVTSPQANPVIHEVTGQSLEYPALAAPLVINTLGSKPLSMTLNASPKALVPYLHAHLRQRQHHCFHQTSCCPYRPISHLWAPCFLHSTQQRQNAPCPCHRGRRQTRFPSYQHNSMCKLDNHQMYPQQHRIHYQRLDINCLTMVPPWNSTST